jgi:superoxide dismutase, Fe-Mn family
MITLPKLTYGFDALEPYIDAKTMEIHYSKHHQTYVDKYNAAITNYPELQTKTVAEVLMGWNQLSIDEKDKKAIKNHGGGVFNHSFFWSILGPKKEIDQTLVDAITKTYGSVDTFKEQFTAAAVGHFGSGWAWLVEDEQEKLQIYSLPNQDSPILTNHKPLIALDVWEHAYYLKYQNRRAEYVTNWWNVLKLLP